MSPRRRIGKALVRAWGWVMCRVFGWHSTIVEHAVSDSPVMGARCDYCGAPGFIWGRARYKGAAA